MRRFVASSLVFLSASGNLALAQTASQASPAAPPTAQTAHTTAPQPSAPPPPNTLLDGTAVKLRLAETISSSNAKVGQQVPFEVTEDVTVQGVTVLAKGAQALASVTDANAKKSMGRAGKLNVNVDSARLTDGEKVQLRAVQDNKGGGHVGAMTGAMVATAIVFFPAAPLFLFIHGKDVTIPKGTEVTAFVQGDMKLDMAKFAAADAPGAPVLATSQTASLTVEASVPNCDIEVDGNFVGNTPSTLNLAPGKHQVTVKKAGYLEWSRSMLVASGSVRLSAEMVKK
jgi:PEGA domain